MKNAWIKDIGPTGPKYREDHKEEFRHMDNGTTGPEDISVLWEQYGITLQYYLDQIKKLEEENFILQQKLKSAKEVIHKNQLLTKAKKPYTTARRNGYWIPPVDDKIPNTVTIQPTSASINMPEITNELNKITAKLSQLDGISTNENSP